MKNITGKLLTSAVALTLALSLGMCKRNGDSGLKVAGSDTMVQLAQKLARAYMEGNPGENVSVQGGGSGTGIAALLNESIHIGNASREMKQKEWDLAKSKKIDIKENVIALDALSIVVNPSNPVKKLTIEQMSDIYSGKINNWKQVGGNDATIIAISRENNSGTHVYFKEEVLRKGDSKSDMEFGKDVTFAVSSQQIIDQIKLNKNAIGYVGMGWVTADVKALTVKNAKDGNYYEPTLKNVEAKKYPLSRPLLMYTNEKFHDKTSKFIDFALSEKGKAVITELGFIPVN